MKKDHVIVDIRDVKNTRKAGLRSQESKGGNAWKWIHIAYVLAFIIGVGVFLVVVKSIFVSHEKLPPQTPDKQLAPSNSLTEQISPNKSSGLAVGHQIIPSTSAGQNDVSPIKPAIKQKVSPTQVNCDAHKLRPYFKFDEDWTTAGPWDFVRPPRGKSFGRNKTASCVNGIWVVDMIDSAGATQSHRVTELIIPPGKWQWDYKGDWEDYKPKANAAIDWQFRNGRKQTTPVDVSDGSALFDLFFKIQFALLKQTSAVSTNEVAIRRVNIVSRLEMTDLLVTGFVRRAYAERHVPKDVLGLIDKFFGDVDSLDVEFNTAYCRIVDDASDLNRPGPYKALRFTFMFNFDNPEYNNQAMVLTANLADADKNVHFAEYGTLLGTGKSRGVGHGNYHVWVGTTVPFDHADLRRIQDMHGKPVYVVLENQDKTESKRFEIAWPKCMTLEEANRLAQKKDVTV